MTYFVGYCVVFVLCVPFFAGFLLVSTASDRLEHMSRAAFVAVSATALALVWPAVLPFFVGKQFGARDRLYFGPSGGGE